MPCITQRGTHPTYFPEFHMFLGPQALGDTGDGGFAALFGRMWAFLHCDDDRWFLLQWVGSDHLIAEGLLSPGWKVIEEPLLDLPGLACGTQQRFTAAFDQNARLIVAYEDNERVFVTRWDDTTGDYLQNVDFAGVDPALLVDAAVTDSRGYPTLDDDDWSVREAFDAGVRVWFEWLPEPAFRTTAIPDSDVLLFYLSADRERVMCRVQREVYGTERLLHDFGQPVILDQAVALLGRYELLVSNQAGVRLPQVLISDPYLGDFIINPEGDSPVAAGVAPEGLMAETQILLVPDDAPVTAAVAPEDVEVVAQLLTMPGRSPATGAVAPEDARVTVMVFVTSATDFAVGAVAPEDVLVRKELVIVEAKDELVAAVAPEAIRVQSA